MNPVTSDIVNTVHDAVGAMSSATVLINGITTKIDAAVQAALANGATEAELQPVVAANDELKAAKDQLAAAVAANP